MRVLTLIFFVVPLCNFSFTQEKNISKIIERTEHFWSVDEMPEPPETTIYFYNENGLDTLTLSYVDDSLAQMTRTVYNSNNREKSFTRLTGEGDMISSVQFSYIEKKNKTEIRITDENRDLFSKEVEYKNDSGQVIRHDINYVEGKLRSSNQYTYDDQGREKGYYSYDGKRLDFFSISEYNEQGFVSSDRMGVVPFGEDNLVYKYIYPKVDEKGNWLVREQYQEDQLLERTTRELFYR